MAKYFLFLMLAIPVILVACGGGSDDVQLEAGVPSADSNRTGAPGEGGDADFLKGFDTGFSEEAAGISVAPAEPPAVFGDSIFSEDFEGAAVGSNLQVTDRQVISTASISLEVEMVDETTATIRTIAEGLGGFVERLSSSGNEDRQQASITIRVPQAQFFNALDQLSALGEVQSQNVGSDDVSEQFIDLQARLNSSLREEESLLSLLDRVEGISEVLVIERELNRIRSEIERLQGQLNFLERRVDLATITISLFSPGVDRGEPPSATLVIELSNVTRTVEDVKALVNSLDGELDQVFVTVQDGKESARITLRVFGDDFEASLTTIEGMGNVTSKQVREGTLSQDGDLEPPDDPDARMEITLLEGEGSNTGTIIAIAAPIGGTAFVLLMAVLFTVTYRVGRSRGGSLL